MTDNTNKEEKKAVPAKDGLVIFGPDATDAQLDAIVQAFRDLYYKNEARKKALREQNHDQDKPASSAG